MVHGRGPRRVGRAGLVRHAVAVGRVRLEPAVEGRVDPAVLHALRVVVVEELLPAHARAQRPAGLSRARLSDLEAAGRVARVDVEVLRVDVAPVDAHHAHALQLAVRVVLHLLLRGGPLEDEVVLRVPDAVVLRVAHRVETAPRLRDRHVVVGEPAAGYVAVGGVALQAFVITLAILASMLTLYYFRILQATPMFTRVVFTLVVGIFIAYGVSFILMLFGIYVPFISVFTTPTEGGGMWIGIGLNLFILLIASLMLIIDFKIIEDHIKAGSPKRIEWFLGFCLLVTLAWIYMEAVKLSARLAILAGNRD